MRPSAIAYVYIAPAFALLLFVLFSPVLYGFWFTLFRIEYGAPTDFIGLGNYARLLEDPSLLPTLGRSGVFTAACVVFTIIIAMALAIWINRLPARTAFIVQMVVIVPWIISAVVATLLFRWVFVNDIGVASYVIQLLGFDAMQPLNNPTGAMVLLVAVSVWKRIGYAVLVLLAGLKSIPDDYDEAARIDGANNWQIFRMITLPLLKTPLLLIAIVLTLSTFNTVETPLVMTGGGPGDATRILAMDVYERAFTNYDLGSATSLAIVMFAGNILLVMSYVRLARWQA
ncbi:MULTISPECIES: sugar ABC transporter permease [unclassified Chelatococcus]|uniref:carbohydrate ABC transporter permease n=1 Tax=unclassified Chelatococcus TaxID=2638111 RepID=UPI001BD141D8|nr:MULTISPECIES: sugar ABC transporter permease [unclassified Chelatococcus]CAH1651410.1 Multiple sugar transport system permease protein [Hyphomicrobiales bacterium]MBS7739855.1 sugar ABC transporter permease [Chelatococcus sp. HY11]MBX3545499.1 sugar ABC transporter permease [Chelatococcus sp.]MCO5078846.1 sugar ABC transporter permease [Chelatococcus sp.]CAH1686282.1 Multiple sugar transport system permease protein [Hyphomicrobiales bacterium]